MAKKARIFVVRHGETDANVQKIIQGHLNTRLNSTGKRQAEMVAEALRDVPFVAAFTSDLARASEVSFESYRLKLMLLELTSNFERRPRQSCAFIPK